jgi:hypothetical protein
MDGLQGKMAAGVAWKGNCVGRAALNAPPPRPLIRIAAAMQSCTAGRPVHHSCCWLPHHHPHPPPDKFSWGAWETDEAVKVKKHTPRAADFFRLLVGPPGFRLLVGPPGGFRLLVGHPGLGQDKTDRE